MKYTFTLKDINIEEIHKKYDLNLSSNLTSTNIPINITKITDLVTLPEKDDSPFLNENKKDLSFNITMMDLCKEEFLPKNTDIKCFWCRNNFDWIPIGCPLKYCSSQLEKIYYSEITKDKYTIKENISKEKERFIINKINEDNIKSSSKFKIINKDYYEVDGIFCSFNCCLSFIDDNRWNPTYKYSKNLLKKIYTEVYNKHPSTLIPSPSYRLLKEYGGEMSIEEYRKKIGIIRYDEVCFIKENLKFKACGLLYQEKR
jgi:hypothetical protein